MTGSQIGTTELQDLLQRGRAGDRAARDRLAQSVYQRLEQLARQMLRRFPALRRREDTGDILHGALVRFVRALEVTSIRDTQHFYALAATQIRRELIDLARRCRSEQAPEPGVRDLRNAAADTVEDLDRWCAFHEAVSQLPDDERAVFESVFYHDLSQSELADQVGVHPKTIQRRYRSACLQLYERLGGKLPDS